MSRSGVLVPPDEKQRAAVCPGEDADALEDLMAERADVEVVTDVLHQLQDQLLKADRQRGIQTGHLPAPVQAPGGRQAQTDIQTLCP